METTPISLKLYFPDKIDSIPPLCEENVNQLFAYFIQSGTALPFCICDFLKKLALSHFHEVVLRNVNQLDSKDADMYLLGEISPFSCIMASYYLNRPQYGHFLNILCLPPERKDYQYYNAILQNRIEEEARIFNPNEENTVLSVFNHLIEKPFYIEEPYFIAGVSTSKLLYETALMGVEKILDFSNGPTLP